MDHLDSQPSAMRETDRTGWRSGVRHRAPPFAPPHAGSRGGLGVDLVGRQSFQHPPSLAAATRSLPASDRSRRLRTPCRPPLRTSSRARRDPARAPALRRGCAPSGTRCPARAPCPGGCRALAGSSRGARSWSRDSRPNRPTLNRPSMVVPHSSQWSRVTLSSWSQTGHVAMTSRVAGAATASALLATRPDRTDGPLGRPVLLRHAGALRPRARHHAACLTSPGVSHR